MQRPSTTIQKRVVWCAVLVLGTGLPVYRAAAPSGTLALRGVTVVDVTDGSLDPGQTLLVVDRRIAAIGPAETLAVPEGATVVEAEGAFVIPGLWDMHVHALNPGWDRPFLPLFVANGVTGIRDTWGSTDLAERARAEIRTGERVGPVRMVVAGNLVDGPDPVWSASQVARTPEEGRRLVESLHAEGKPFIKVYSRLSRDTFLAIAERARRLGIPFAGHIPESVRVAEASDAGQQSMEHLYGLLEACSTIEQEAIDAKRERLETSAGEEPKESNDAFRLRLGRRLLATQNAARCQALLERLARNETWQVPTLVTNRGYAYMRERSAEGDPRLRYMPSSVTRSWHPQSNRFRKETPEERWAVEQEQYAWSVRMVGRMAKAGVPLLAGTDPPNPWSFPGFSLHEELALFVEAGLTPLEALRTATLAPARFFGRTDELGTVEQGKLADLVLLAKNPLVDIRHTTTIQAVIADGRLYQRADLDRILASAARFQGAPR